MSVKHAGDEGRPSPGKTLEVAPEELLARGRPFPPYEDMVIEELSDEEAESFWAAITQA
jgi:hypothetical protein